MLRTKMINDIAIETYITKSNISSIHKKHESKFQSKNIFFLVFLILSLFILASCGGGDDDSVSDNSVASITGQFIDDPVAGLVYQCSSGAFSETNANGEFTCPAGDNITFYLGANQLGPVPAVNSIISPYTLFPDDPLAAINLARLLQSIDSDNDPDTITIDDSLVASLPNSINFSSPTFDSDVGIPLVSAAQAADSLNESIALFTAVYPVDRNFPVADAGVDQTVTIGSTVTLDASGSFDADGDTLTYVWGLLSKPSESSAVIVDWYNFSTPTFVVDRAGEYEVLLMVSDGLVTDIDTVIIMVNDDGVSHDANLVALSLTSTLPADTLSPAFDSNIFLYTAIVGNDYSWITITPTASDSNATIVVIIADRTIQVNSGGSSGTISLDVGENSMSVVVTAEAGNTLAYDLTVTRLAISTDANLSDLSLSVGTLSPAFNASEITYTATVDNASDSITVTPITSDTNAIVTVNGTTVASGAASTAIALSVGTNAISVVVTAEDGSTSKTYTVTVTASTGNSAPVADAGSNQNVMPGSLVTLDGSGSSDADGDPLTYTWTLDTVPFGSSAMLSDATAIEPTFTADLVGAYTVSLVVYDGAVSSAADTIGVNVVVAAARQVYLADQTTDGVFELYSGTLAGETPVKLNDTLLPGGNVTSWQESADGTTVVYRADPGGDNRFELYSVPIGGGTPVKLNDDLPTEGYPSVYEFTISPDSATVVYTADQEVDNWHDLYSVPIGGGLVIKLDGPTFAGGVYKISISPDSSTVVYSGDLDTNDVNGVYAVPIDGTAPGINISDPFEYSGSPPKIQIDPTGTYAVYTVVDFLSGGVFYSARLDGGGAVQLNDPFPGGGVSYKSSPPISADGSTVVYYLERDFYSVAIGGGTPIQLTDVVGWDAWGGDYLISPDSSTVIYTHTQDEYNKLEIFSRSIDGSSASVKLSGDGAIGGSNDPILSPDGSTVVFRGQLDSTLNELYAVPLVGGSPVKLNGPIVGSQGISKNLYRISADGTTVVYVADQDTDSKAELYAVSIGGGEPIKLSGAMSTLSDVQKITFAADGSTVIYQADQDAYTVNELYAVPMTGGTSVKINGLLVNRGDVVQFIMR